MFLKNKNIIFKIRRSKVTDHAALIDMPINNQYFGDVAPEQSLVLFMVYRYIDLL